VELVRQNMQIREIRLDIYAEANPQNENALNLIFDGIYITSFSNVVESEEITFAKRIENFLVGFRSTMSYWAALISIITGLILLRLWLR
jgi:hypothetical protein